MDCANHDCGAEISTPGNMYSDGQEIRCSSCGTINSISLQEGEDVSETNDEAWEAYVGSWTCAHGVDGDDQCDTCNRGETVNVEEIQ